MSLFKRFLRKAAKPPAKPIEQCLIVHFDYGLPNLDGLYEQADRLTEALTKAGVGEYDGHEIAASLTDGFHYMYGSDADLLLEVAEPVFRATPWFHRAELTRRYGPPKDGVQRVVTQYAA
jgi:hypothetical protein